MQILHGCHFWQMLRDYIRRSQNRLLLARINAAYADGPDPSEQTLRRKSKLLHRGILNCEMDTESYKPE